MQTLRDLLTRGASQLHIATKEVKTGISKAKNNYKEKVENKMAMENSWPLRMVLNFQNPAVSSLNLQIKFADKKNVLYLHWHIGF